jgi:hypothetical protein
MNRFLTLIVIGLAALLASCGSSVSSSTQAGLGDIYSMVVTPTQFTLDSGDHSVISATVDMSYNNSAARAIAPQPPIKFYSSDTRVSVSSAGDVCAGQWDTLFVNCVATSTLPTGYVTITAYDASHNVKNTTLVSVHEPAKKITLNAPTWGSAPAEGLGKTCVSQNAQVQYVAAPVDANGNTVTNVFDNDYIWAVGNPTVASVSSYGQVIAVNPGVTSVTATLNGLQSVPLSFVTCPPAAIVLASSPYTNGTPVPPYSTADLDNLSIGDEYYLTSTLVDTNGQTLVTSPLTTLTSNPLTGGISSVLALTSKLTANSSGRFTVMASCTPPACNPGVNNFTVPGATTYTTGEASGFGYPIYSNLIGATVHGTTGSAVLVTGTAWADGTTVTAPYFLAVYDSESLSLSQTINLPNLPNSLVVAPNGATAYVGSSDGLVVVNPVTYSATPRSYPVENGTINDVVTGTVLGVSPDSRYVVLSDVVNGLVFFIDTTVAKVAMRYPIRGITSVTFADDDSHFWIAGTSGVYTYNGDTFVPTSTNASSGVNALAWMPDGQSYFASGSQLINYSTCNDQNPQLPSVNLPTTVVGGLSTTALNGVPHLLGLDASQWFDYSVTTTAQIGNPAPEGNVCLSKVTVNPPVTKTSTLQCTAQQISFSPTLEQAFITGVDPSCTSAEPVLHGYDVVAQQEILLTTTNPVVPLSGGVLNDGRKLYFGSWDATAQTATLHRIDLSTGTGTQGTRTEDLSTSVALVPSFVAVVPK